MIPRSASHPVQRAMYARIAADPVLSELGVSVYDDVPEPAALPYVVIGESMESPDDSHGSFGSQTVPTLHVWSDYAGTREADAIADRLVSLFHQMPLQVEGHHHISTRFEFRQSLRDPLTRTRHVPIRFRVTTSVEE